MRGRFRFGFVIERMIGVLILGLEMELSQHFLKLVVELEIVFSCPLPA